MELKLLHQPRVQPVPILLIVPYGIETSSGGELKQIVRLLIVPYGIETIVSPGFLVVFKLLIVPYGIETYIFNASSIS